MLGGDSAEDDELRADRSAGADDEDAGLADRLWAARETAEAVKAADGRSRAALYRALSLAYDFALAAHRDPDEYAELLEEAGVKAQARAPMTPIVKLVFGIDYDKARLTEFAAALSYAAAPAGRPRRVPGVHRGSRAASRRWSRPSARRAGPSRRPTRAAKRPGRGFAPRRRSSLAEAAGGRGIRAGAHPPRRRRRHEPVALVDDAALVERASARAA